MFDWMFVSPDSCKRMQYEDLFCHARHSRSACDPSSSTSALNIPVQTSATLPDFIFQLSKSLLSSVNNQRSQV
ncbi:MAG: hypothetical protein LCH54_06430 [Bacteroidetes bacterium]|nr:hypothetical protein [Bacteroidota bacterium]